MADNLITVGSGNDTIYVDGSIYGGSTYFDGSIATLMTSAGSSTMSVGMNDTIDAGAGDDIISVISGSNLYIVGGDGSDSIQVGAYYSRISTNITISGGDGNDSIEYYHGYYSSIDGGYGNDSIYNSGSYASIDGGDGNDYIDNCGAYASINGGSGDDYIYNGAMWGYGGGGYASIDGGYGNDSIYNSGSYANIDGGDGNDLIYNYSDLYSTGHYTGNYATITGGTGIDTIYGDGSTSETFIHSADTDIIFGFDSSDTLSIESGTVTSSVSSGSDVILMTSNNSSIILKNTALGNIVFNDGWIGYQTVSGTDSTGTDSTGTDSTGTDSTGSNSTRTDSNDTIYVDTNIETIISSSTSNIISLYSPVIDAGSGNDRIEIIDGVNLSVVGGTGNDYIQNISGNLVSMNGGEGSNTLVGADSESDLFVYSGGQDLIQNFYIGDSLEFGSHTISSSVVSDNNVILSFDQTSDQGVTIEGVGSENLVLEDGFITYIASEDVEYEYIEIFGSDVGSDSPIVVDNSNGITSRTIIRFVGSETISVESNFRTEDIKFAFYDSDGELYTTPYRSEETRAFVALNATSAEFVANPYSTQDLNYGFKSEGSISSWDVSLSAGNDRIHIEDVESGNFDGGSGIDYFHVTVSLTHDISLTGGSDTADYFYATSGTVSSASEQAKITITDIDFNGGDVILVDAGIQNLTSDFFGEGVFYNFANAQQASTEGAIARNVFDATEIVKNLDMEFSMAKFANRSEMPTGSDTSNINSTNVLWVNDVATVIELEGQTDSVLFFTDSNNFGDALYLGSQNFDDTIHAGANDTIDAGGGNDQIYVGSSTHVIYSEGNDTIKNWTSTAILDLNALDTMPSISVLGEDLLIGSTRIENVAGSDIQYRFDYEDGLVRVASNGRLKYGSEVTYYAGSTLILDTDENVTIDLSDSKYENISVIDAGNGSGADEFIYDSGNITIRNGDSTDVVDLSRYSFDEVSREFTDSGLIIVTDTDSSLQVEGTNMTQFFFADGIRTADFVNKSF